MDGLDGLASIELIFACLGAVGLYWLAGVPELIALPFALAVSVLGFLCWNFPPARIFMGDVGSNFLGLLVGVFSMQAARVDEQFFWSWLILLGVFFVDATFTLLRRFIQGFKVFEAHQSHAYQKAVNAIGGKHLPVVLTVLLINMFWLMPIAFAVGLGYIKGVYGLLMAYTPLILLSLKWKAGVTENHTVSAELA